MTSVEAALGVLFLPLAAFAVQIFVGKRLPRGGDWVSTGAIFAALALSVWVFSRMFVPGAFPAAETREWFRCGAFVVTAGVHVDAVTAVMLVVVTLVSALVHLYSIAYMHKDPRYSRYFAYLSLFSFSMLGLVLSDSLLFLFVFWELVGVSSYLLIGFWFEKPAAAAAAKKAFLVNRVGDVGFFIGILIVFSLTGAFRLEDIFAAAAGAGVGNAIWTVAGLCLFCGAVGKSAQFPLHVWLPDAMEGPTPVSALIHAATMVAAGVYLVARIFPILTAEALGVIALVGVVTAMLAASIALVANDIKKVLAYSTVSQLGFMIAALGAGSVSAALFHLTTHAAFKACLFLGSGSVIHAVHTQDIRKMGGLWRKMPITFGSFLVATLALAGLPYVTSGFFSKDLILAAGFEQALERGGAWTLFPVALAATAGLTAFYMFRLVALTFLGEPRDAHAYAHAHESPLPMTVPLVILAALSVGPVFALGGPEGLSGLWTGQGWFLDRVRDVPNVLPFAGPARAPAETAHRAHLWTLATAIPASLGGILLALYLYLRRPDIPVAIARALAPLHTFLVNKWYIDEAYQATVVRATLAFARRSAAFDNAVIDGTVNAAGRAGVRAGRQTGRFDNGVVDGAVGAVGIGTYLAGQALRLVQSGRIQSYVTVLLLGFAAFMIANLATALAAVAFIIAVGSLPAIRDLLGGRDE